jgi:hypothetical protein
MSMCDWMILANPRWFGQVSEVVGADRDDDHAAEDQADRASKNSRTSAGSSAAKACSH